MVRLSFICGLAAAFALVIGSFADAGFGHHRRQLDPSCAVEPGCSAFEPACAIEPSCEMEPDCGAVTCCPTFIVMTILFMWLEPANAALFRLAQRTGLSGTAGTSCGINGPDL